MAVFVVNQPIATREPTIEVDAGLAPGLHRFQLEVFTADGRRSQPDAITVTIGRLPIPIPIPIPPIPRPPGPLQPE